jgi:hypothetical protein
MVSSNASLSAQNIMDAAIPSQTLFFQLYKNRNDEIAEKRVREMDQLGFKAIFLTVDAIVAGNRERDIRSPWVLDDQEKGFVPVWDENNPTGEEADMFGTAGGLVANDDRDMTWEKVNFLDPFRLWIYRLAADHPMATKHHQIADRYQGFVFLTSQKCLYFTAELDLLHRNSVRRRCGPSF